MSILENKWTLWGFAAVFAIATAALTWWVVGSIAQTAMKAGGQQQSAVAAAALGHLLTEGGFTIDPRTGRPIGSVDAWAVSIAGAEERHRSLPSLETLSRYLERHASRFAGSPDLYFGGWRDNLSGEWVLDVTCLIPDRRQAEVVGRRNRQRCIFHLARQEEAWLPVESLHLSTATSALQGELTN